jgi:hypothetical protein
MLFVFICGDLVGMILQRYEIFVNRKDLGSVLCEMFGGEKFVCNRFTKEEFDLLW